MAGGSLLLLLDDIAAILDDVSVMTKLAAKKTAGVLGDDLALNAQQVTGVRADRELAVVWAVAKGSFVNKLILVPAALIISAVAAWLITPLLMIGGAFLCYEGAEKVVHKVAPSLLPHDTDDDAAHQQRLKANADEQVDLVALEKDKIRGAIRTDFILSAEIVVISLGVMTAATLATKAAALSAIAILMTVGVYGLVGLIVKLDDMGVHLLNKPSSAAQALGRGLLAFAPQLMRFLSIAGTVAMFLVGGGILVHGVAILSEQAQTLSALSGVFGGLTETLYNGVVGLIAGLLILAGVILGKKLIKK
ncbi:hypothetical protein SAMN02745664_10434 [Moraxella cuniculi DSM 21768]|uniref:Inner membrane protein YedI n=2 Tax=Moraxella cuniculi TaxID=34061 RepID=A0A1N7EC55_9GAMM|nr:DUF808 domain-containing protein [Moraxella cuniculi]OOS05368.1 hypothetical protein B0189_07110 [Moraxella cuniculi]SIR85579.1 hypothetical protein SAMN02745664_10434 [Moraxella cuniculi DSM 21768]VEG12376.1 Inner membrane protein yedI [Moraxella cuniculi]